MSEGKKEDGDGRSGETLFPTRKSEKKEGYNEGVLQTPKNGSGAKTS